MRAHPPRSRQTPEPADGLFHPGPAAAQEWLQGHVVPGCPGQLLSVLSGLVEEKMGGSSGAVRASSRLKSASLFPLILCAFAALQPVPDRRRGSRDPGPERRRCLGSGSACWDAGHEEVNGTVWFGQKPGSSVQQIS